MTDKNKDLQKMVINIDNFSVFFTITIYSTFKLLFFYIKVFNYVYIRYVQMSIDTHTIRKKFATQT